MKLKEPSKNGIKTQRQLNIDKGMKENYGYFLKLGGMYLGWKITPIFYVLNAILHIFLLAYTAYLCLSDLGPMSEAVHFIVLLGMACTSMVNSIYHRDRIDDLFEAMGRGFYDYEGSLDEKSQSEADTLSKESKARKKVFTNIFVVGVAIAGAAVAIIRPVLDNIYVITPKHNDDGVNRYVAVVCWYPLDATVFWQNVVCFVTQYGLIALTPGIVFGTDIIFVCMAEEFTVQLNILSITLKRCKERALHMMKGKDADVTSDEFQHNLKTCLNHCIKHHYLIMDLFQKFKTLNYLVLLWFMVGSSFLLCLSGLIFVSDQVQTLSKATFLCFLSVETTHAFIFCWYGEKILSISMNLGECIYNSSWIETSQTMKYYILIIQARCSMPLKLSAGGYMEINLSTFGNVLSSSYSYFNLLRAVN